MKKPIVGIVGRSRKSDTGFNLMVTPESERMAIITFGGNPILIMPTQKIEYQDCWDKHPTPGELERLTDEEKQMLYNQIELCDGVILPGGDMMFEYDRVICEYCINNDIPILGICMGMQVMCTYDRPVILNEIDKLINHKDLENDYIHNVEIKNNTRLSTILNTNEIKVNSRHGLAVSDSGLSIVSALSEDNIIEAVEFPDKKFAVGVQWHPELNYEYDIYSKKLFEEFIEVCKR